MYLICFLILIFFLFPSDSYAYIDPASGSALGSIVIALISTLFLIVKEFYYKIVSFFLTPFNITLKKNNHNLVFYSGGGQYWRTFKPILESLDKKGVEAIYLTSCKDDEGLNFRSSYVSTRYIGKGLRAYNYLNKLEASVCAMTTPGLDVLQIKRSKGVKHYAYLPHSPIDMGKYKLYSFEGFDSIFLSGAHQEKSLRALETLRLSNKKQLFNAGCPYMDELGKRLTEVKKKSSARNKQYATILIAPTWGKNNLLRVFSVELIKELLKKNYEVIIRPHPQSFIVESKLIQNFKSELSTFKRLKWDNTPDAFESLLRADVLISSLSGIIFDFAFIFDKRPIIVDFQYDFIGQEANDLPFDVWELGMIDKVGIRLKIDEVNLAIDVIEDLLLMRQQNYELDKLREKNLFNYLHSGEFIANALIEIESASEG